MWMVKFDGDAGVCNSCRGCPITLTESFIIFFFQFPVETTHIEIKPGQAGDAVVTVRKI